MLAALWILAGCKQHPLCSRALMPRAGSSRQIHHGNAPQGDRARPPVGSGGRWHLLCPEPGAQQTPRQRRRQHSCGRRPVQRRFQPPPGRSWNKALIFQRLGGFRSAVGHPDRSTCSSPCVALLGEAALCRAPGPHAQGERSQMSRGGSQIPCSPPERGIQMRIDHLWTIKGGA